jgi:hypothetical protein
MGPPGLAAVGFDVSPDERTIAYTRLESVENDIMLVENFH